MYIYKCMFLTSLFILLMLDNKLAKSPSSICMAQVQIRSLQSQLFKYFYPIMLKTFKIYIKTLQTFSLSWVCICTCICFTYSSWDTLFHWKKILERFKIYEVKRLWQLVRVVSLLALLQCELITQGKLKPSLEFKAGGLHLQASVSERVARNLDRSLGPGQGWEMIRKSIVRRLDSKVLAQELAVRGKPGEGKFLKWCQGWGVKRRWSYSATAESFSVS